MTVSLLYSNGLHGHQMYGSWMFSDKLQQLCDAIMSVRAKISEDCLQHLVKSMPQRRKAVLRIKGVQCWQGAPKIACECKFSVQKNAFYAVFPKIDFEMSHSSFVLSFLLIQKLLVSIKISMWKYSRVCLCKSLSLIQHYSSVLFFI